MSFSPPGQGAPSLLSHDEAHTLFHEFGHALHGMLSDVTYPWLSGTAVVARFRRTALAALRALARSACDPLANSRAIIRPASRCRKRCSMRSSAARRYGQGFATAEFLASSFFDMAAHSLPAGGGVRRARRSRRKTLADMGMPEAIAPRHAAPRISSMCSPAPAIRPATTAICGRRCSTPMRSRRSSRPAIRSIPHWRPSASRNSSIPPATSGRRTRPMRCSADARRARRRCCASAALRRKRKGGLSRSAIEAARGNLVSALLLHERAGRVGGLAVGLLARHRLHELQKIPVALRFRRRLHLHDVHRMLQQAVGADDAVGREHVVDLGRRAAASITLSGSVVPAALTALR